MIYFCFRYDNGQFTSLLLNSIEYQCVDTTHTLLTVSTKKVSLSPLFMSKQYYCVYSKLDLVIIVFVQHSDEAKENHTFNYIRRYLKSVAKKRLNT